MIDTTALFVTTYVTASGESPPKEAVTVPLPAFVARNSVTPPLAFVKVPIPPLSVQDAATDPA
jgi:hypothetical protein